MKETFSFDDQYHPIVIKIHLIRVDKQKGLGHQPLSKSPLCTSILSLCGLPTTLMALNFK